MKKTLLLALIALVSNLSVWANNSTVSERTFPTTNWSDYTEDLPAEINDTIIISTSGQLAKLAQLVNEGNNFYRTTFVLANDIDLSAHLWTPIGSIFSGYNRAFQGNLQGQNFEIKGLKIDSFNTRLGVGLIGYAEKGTIRNLGVTNVNINSTSSSTGAIVGYLGSNSSIFNCYSSGHISGTGYVGGLAGCTYSSDIFNSYNLSEVNGDTEVGGICGYNEGATDVVNCYNVGAITGTNYVGAIVGKERFNRDIKNTYYLTGSAAHGLGMTQNDGTSCVSMDESAMKSTDLVKSLNKYLSDNSWAVERYDLWSWEKVDGSYPIHINPNNITYSVAAIAGANGSASANPEGDVLVNTTITFTAVPNSGHRLINWTDNNGNEISTELSFSLALTSDTTLTANFEEGNPLPTTNWSDYTEDLPAEIDDTIIISTAGQLAKLAQLVNEGDDFSGKTLLLANDIDISAHLWTPIGSLFLNFINKPFSGIFNGQGYEIKGLQLNFDEARLGVGLFGYTLRGTIRNLGVTDVYIKSTTPATGAIAGYFGSYSEMFNCYTSGSISGTENVGGIVGTNVGVYLYNSYNLCKVCGTENVGGICGNVQYSYINNCYNIGAITGTNYVGAIVGIESDPSDIENTYYLTGSAAYGLGVSQNDGTSCESLDEAAMKSADFVNSLNENLEDFWATESRELWSWKKVDGSYPILVEPGSITTYSVAAVAGANGTASVTPNGNVEEGTTVSFSATPNYGYKFLNWTDNNGTEISTEASFALTVTADTSLTANFEILTYTIKYNKNSENAIGTIYSQEFTHGIEQQMILNIYTRPGYTFEGWSTVRGGEVEYYDGDVYTATADEIFYAVWKKDDVTTDVEGTEDSAEYSREGNILIFAQPTNIIVYSTTGSLIYNGNVSNYELPNSQNLFIIRTSKQSYKEMRFNNL